MGTKKQILENLKRKSDNFCWEHFVNQTPLHPPKPAPVKFNLPEGFPHGTPSHPDLGINPLVQRIAFHRPLFYRDVAFWNPSCQICMLHLLQDAVTIPDIKWRPKIIPKESKLACSSNKTPRSLHGMSPKCHDILPYSSNSAPGLIPRGFI